MNEIHQISLKLRLGIDTHANIQPEVLLQKWQDFMDRKLDSSNQPASSVTPHTGTLTASGSTTVRRK